MYDNIKLMFPNKVDFIFTNNNQVYLNTCISIGVTYGVSNNCRVVLLHYAALLPKT